MQRQLRSSWSSPRGLLTCACAVALLLALLPWRFSFWLSTPATLAGVLIAPVASGLTKVLSPVSVQRPPHDPAPGLSPLQVEQLNLTNLQLDAENRRLRAQIESLQSGLKVAGSADFGVPRIIAPALGLRGSMLQLRTDDLEPMRDGRSPIGPGSVVVLSGSWLVGTVTAPGRTISLATIITDAGAGGIAASAGGSAGAVGAGLSGSGTNGELRAVIRPMPGEIGAATLPSEVGLRLRPDGKGNLIGPAYALETPGPATSTSAAHTPLVIQPGMRVRLADPAWPRCAQMLIVGEVASVTAAPNDRQQVVVRPMFTARDLAASDLTILVLPPLDAVPTRIPERPR